MKTVNKTIAAIAAEIEYAGDGGNSDFKSPGENTNATSWEADCKIMVRTKEGDSLNGVIAYGDGISFRAARPMPGGKIIELVVCETFLFEAEVVGCAPMPASVGGYLVRARFHGISPALTNVIRNEINQLVESAR